VLSQKLSNSGVHPDRSLKETFRCSLECASVESRSRRAEESEVAWHDDDTCGDVDLS
jgi:hypothetical protein